MRARLGDTVILCDGNAVEYTATITGFGDECVEFRVEPGLSLIHILVREGRVLVAA